MADWLCPHTPDICDYPETCATKLAAEVARLKQGAKDPSKFVQVTVDDRHQVIAIDTIARIYKAPAADCIRGDKNGPHITVVALKGGDKVVVDESIKTLQARIGCDLLP